MINDYGVASCWPRLMVMQGGMLLGAALKMTVIFSIVVWVSVRST